MDGSGDDPPLLSLHLDHQFDAEPTTIVQDTVLTKSEFCMNPYRVVWIALETLFFLLISVLTVASKRDFIKVFLFFLLLPIGCQIGTDIFIEVKASLDRFPSTDVNWYYFYGDYNNIHIRFLPNEGLRIYEDIIVHYTSYIIFRGLPIISLVSFIFTDWLFWTLLFSSIPLLIYSYRSILRPEHTPYLAFWPPFLHIQVVPLLFAGSDMLLLYLQSHNGVLIAISALIKLTALIIASLLLLLVIFCPCLLCHRLALRTKSSGFVYIRSARSRLIWISLFILFNHTFSIPYIVWSGLSTWKDLSVLFSIDDGFSDWIATNAFVLHISI
ncbi:hypothetical protein PFISCL1PPCAC_29045, partial [Pristionchus fissidentatus]